MKKNYLISFLLLGNLYACGNNTSMKQEPVTSISQEETSKKNQDKNQEKTQEKKKEKNYERNPKKIEEKNQEEIEENINKNLKNFQNQLFARPSPIDSNTIQKSEELFGRPTYLTQPALQDFIKENSLNEEDCYILFMHGGKTEYISDLLTGKIKGYELQYYEEDYKKEEENLKKLGLDKITGIQITPITIVSKEKILKIPFTTNSLNSRARDYATRSKKKNLERYETQTPAILYGLTSAKYVLAQDRAYEAGIPDCYIENIENFYIEHPYSKTKQLPQNLKNILIYSHSDKFDSIEISNKFIEKYKNINSWAAARVTLNNDEYHSIQEKFDYNPFFLKLGLSDLIEKQETKKLDAEEQTKFEQLNHLKPF